MLLSSALQAGECCVRFLSCSFSCWNSTAVLSCITAPRSFSDGQLSVQGEQDILELCTVHGFLYFVPQPCGLLVTMWSVRHPFDKQWMSLALFASSYPSISPLPDADIFIMTPRWRNINLPYYKVSFSDDRPAWSSRWVLTLLWVIVKATTELYGVINVLL